MSNVRFLSNKWHDKPGFLNSYTIALTFIVILAVVLRTWGIRFGLPYQYHYDEHSYVCQALNLGKGTIGNQPNPTGFSNILFIEYGIYFIFGYVFKIFSSMDAFEWSYRDNPSNFYFMSRMTIVFFGSLSVIVVYYIGKLLYSIQAGLLASFFLSVSYLHTRISHYGIPDILLTFFVILTVLFSILYMRQKNSQFIFLTSLTTGFALSVKWSIFPLIILPMMCLIFSEGIRLSEHRRFPVKNFFICFFGVVLGFLVGGFQVLIKPKVFWDYLLYELESGSQGGFWIWQIDKLSGWLFYLKTLAFANGYILLVFSIFSFGFLAILFIFDFLTSNKINLLNQNGSSYRILENISNNPKISALVEKKGLYFVFLIFPAMYYLIMGSTNHYFARYALPILPFILILSAIFISTIADLFYKGMKIPKKILIAMIALVIGLLPLIRTIQHNILLNYVDTRTQAKEWIEANIPENAKRRYR